jgi:NAD-dependent DNA ligase
MDRLIADISSCRNKANVSMDANSCERILHIHGIGSTTVVSLLRFAANKNQQAIVEKLCEKLTILPSPVQLISSEGPSSLDTVGQRLSGRKVVFTGKFDGLTRAELKETCIKLGIFEFI